MGRSSRAATAALLVAVVAGITAASALGAPSLSGARVQIPQPNIETTVDLTALGTEDWAVWGTGSSTSLSPDQSKAGGTAISNLTDIPATVPPAPLRGLGQFTPISSPPATHPFRFSWADGSPSASGSAVRAGLQHDGQAALVGANGAGFSFTLPADTTTRTLRMWVALNRAAGQLTATLSDGSAPAYSDTVNIGGADFIGQVYTLTYEAASAGQTLTVTWRQTVASCPSFGCDNVSLHAVALSGGGGGATTAPTLVRAVPTGGGTTIVGRVDGGAASADLTFVSSATCSDGQLGGTPTTIGALAGVPLDPNGYFSVGVANVPILSFVAAGVTGSPDLSSCVVAKAANDSWPTAFGLTGALTTQDVIDSPGQSKWYAFDVQPGSEVKVNLTGLPADYDLALFKDITQAYTDLTSPQDLTRLSAEYAPSIFSPSIFSPSIFSPSIFSPDAYAPSIFSPSIFSPSIFSPSIFSPSIFSPSIFSPSIFSPSIFSPSIFSPSIFSPSEFSPSIFTPTIFSPDAFASAQTRSLVAVSATPGTADELVVANTWINTGRYYVRVSSRTGAFSTDGPYQVSVTRGATSCPAGIADIGSAPAPEQPRDRRRRPSSSPIRRGCPALRHEQNDARHTAGVARRSDEAARSSTSRRARGSSLSRTRRDGERRLPVREEPARRGDQGRRRLLPGEQSGSAAT